MTEARYPFTPAALMYAPALPGVYLLWDREVLIFVGHAPAPQTILERLMDHYCGRTRPAQATHCGWELVDVAPWLDRLGTVGVGAQAANAVYAEAD